MSKVSITTTAELSFVTIV